MAKRYRQEKKKEGRQEKLGHCDPVNPERTSKKIATELGVSEAALRHSAESLRRRVSKVHKAHHSAGPL